MTVLGLSAAITSLIASQSRSGNVTVLKSSAARTHAGPSSASFRRVSRINSTFVMGAALLSMWRFRLSLRPRNLQACLLAMLQKTSSAVFFIKPDHCPSSRFRVASPTPRRCHHLPASCTLSIFKGLRDFAIANKCAPTPRSESDLQAGSIARAGRASGINSLPERQRCNQARGVARPMAFTLKRFLILSTGVPS